MNIIKLILFVPCIFTFIVLIYSGINGFKGVYIGLEQSPELSITDNRKVAIADRIFYICLIIFSLLFVVTDLSVLNVVDLLPMDAITTLVEICSIPLCIITIIVGATTAEDLNEILNLNINTKKKN